MSEMPAAGRDGAGGPGPDLATQPGVDRDRTRRGRAEAAPGAIPEPNRPGASSPLTAADRARRPLEPGPRARRDDRVSCRLAGTRQLGDPLGKPSRRGRRRPLRRRSASPHRRRPACRVDGRPQYRINPKPEALRRFAFGAVDPDAALRSLAEASIRGVVGQRSLDDLLTDQRRAIERAAAKQLHHINDFYKMIIIIIYI